MSFYQHFKTKSSFLEAMRTFHGNFGSDIDFEKQQELLDLSFNHILFLKQEISNIYKGINPTINSREIEKQLYHCYLLCRLDCLQALNKKEDNLYGMNFNLWLEIFPKESKNLFDFTLFFDYFRSINDEKTLKREGTITNIKVFYKKDKKITATFDIPNDFKILETIGINENAELFPYYWACFFLKKTKDPNYADFEMAIFNLMIYRKFKKQIDF